MLTKEDLLTQNEIPKISDITLKLYVEFFQENLHGRIYEYKLNNEWIIKLKMDKSRIHHLLGIQHIDVRIDKNDFVENVENDDITIETLKDSRGKKQRFNDMKDRIVMFACLNYLLENCTYFYIPDGVVPNTRVPGDFLLFNIVSKKGMQLSIKKNTNNEYYKAISIMPTREKNRNKYIEGLDDYKVIQLRILDENNELIKEIKYNNHEGENILEDETAVDF